MSEDGGDDSPPRPKRKIKKVMIVSSASESESDEIVAVPGTRRKRLRVLSDEESSDSSGSSVVVAGVRRRRALPKLRDSDSDGSGGWVTDSDSGKAVAAPPKPTSGFASDSSEGNSDKCSICLLRFTDQETGTPENCEHVFCFDCITEWSKNVNTCPVDRITFNSIIVRACMGGRVLRTEEVKVTERRPSVEMLVFEDIPTDCEICRRSDNEDTMLLCDSCDLGYHMHCLTPPLTEIPIDQWLCPNCDDLLEDAIHISEVDELFSDMVEIPEGPRPSALRTPRNVRRSARNSTNTEQPSTSSGHRRASSHELPTTSRASRTGRPSSNSTTRRQTSTTKRRRKRRKPKTIVIEYEIEENGKFPITKRVTRRLKKRKTKRQPRTVARRTHVRASVRAKLASLKSDQRLEITQSANAAVGVQNLAIQRHRAGIPSLSLMGDPNQLDYFSDEENHISEAATTAVAARPTANILSAYRQARRKMIAIPSPQHASAAPDVLSNILESQTLLHSKKSFMSISVDGSVNIKLQTNYNHDRSKVLKKGEKVDLTKAEASTKKAPTYPGQSRGGGGWGGGYRGSYQRDHPQNNANGNFGRGGNYDGNYGGNYQSRPGQNFNNFQGNMRREEPEYFDSFPRRPHQFPHNDEPSYSDRLRRAGPVDNSRGPNFGPHLPQFQRNNDQATGRHSLNSSWPTYGGSGPRADAPPLQPRHSFGGFENPVDMRMSQVPLASTNTTVDYSNAEAPRQDKRQPPLQSLPESQPYRPLAQPPIFNFPKVSEVEKSEDEKSDSGLVIDTEKYDPTEPTNDDDSGDEDRVRARRVPQPPAAPAPPAPAPAVAAPADPLPALLPPPLPPPSALLPNQVQTILAGIDTSGMNVPHNILDDAVRQVLKEHRNLMSTPSGADARNDRSDEDSDGDCPNFSIYSATSVHIASNTNLTDDITNKPNNEDNLEDLIQEDDEATDAAPAVAKDTTEKKHDAGKSKVSPVNTSLKKTEEEYKEKVSKRCPITTVTRNPIKIKLNTPSLIKRQVSLYDEEEASQEPEESENPVEVDKSEDNITNRVDNHAEKSSNEDVDDSNKKLDSATNAQFRDTFTKESPNITESPQNKETERKSVDDEEIRRRISGSDPEEKSNCPSERSDGDKTPNSLDKSDARDNLEAHSDNDSRSPSRSPRDEPEVDKEIDNVEKMTESISETEDERSYTPCLDENKSTKDASFENDKDKGLEGLDTEMISEDEGNEMFSENEDAPSETSRRSPARAVAESEEGEIPDKRKESKKSESREESGKKKKKKESKKEGKDKSKSKKKGGDVSFKKLSKSGKERNYRDRDKDDKKDRDRRGSDAEARHKKRREKRKDLERYDVRTVVTEKRRKLKDPFGRDVSPRGRSPTRSPAPASPARRRSPAPRSPPRSLSAARRRSPSPRRSPAFSRGRRSPSPQHPRRSPVRMRRSLSRSRRSPSRARKSPSRGRKSPSRGRKSPSRPRRSPSPVRRTTSRGRRSPARRSAPRRISPNRTRSVSRPRRRRSASSPRASPRRRSPARRKRRRSAGASPSRKASKKRKRPRSAARRASPAVPRRRSPSPPSVRPPSPRTPPSPAEREPSPRPRADRLRRRLRDAPPPSKEVFTSGDNILVSVSFKEQERGEDGERRKRKEARRTRRKRRRVPAETEAVKPVAIIDLERSPFRELTPSPKNVIVLSDSDHGEKEPAAPAAPLPAPAEPAPEPPALGPQTPPEPAAPEPEPAPAPAPPDVEEGGSPDAYDPFEPTRSASASPAHAGSPGAGSPPSLTLEAAQRSNLSADEVLARRPLSPAEKVLALLQSQRAAEPEPLPEPPRPEPPRQLPKLFPGKPSPIKSNPVKPMQAARLPWPPSDAGASPYSPGSSDFGELFEPPVPRRASKLKPHKKKGKMAVGVAVDEENLKILDELPSSAVALQVKNKFLKKLNRQERVVEEVKLVLKPHYNRRRVSKDDYKEILRRCVPKICHNKTGEINPTKIQALVEAYVKKFRKKHKLGIA